MKTRNRATIVGEVTGGGANPGGPMAINDNFRINMPTGRAINPVTGTNWEGVGVKPDVAVDAKSALEKAHELAKAAAKAYRKDQMSGVIAMAEKVDKALTKAEKLLENKQSKQAQAVVNSALGMAVDNGLGGESAVNMLGYDYLMSQAKADMAVLVFTFNTQTYPNSYNTFDSLGEAYMAAGNKKLAKKHYLKSLELNPENSNAKSMLEQL
jgi:tetratricopeptide (TPR) repeat protein